MKCEKCGFKAKLPEVMEWHRYRWGHHKEKDANQND